MHFHLPRRIIPEAKRGGFGGREMTSKDLSNTFSHPRQPILHEFKPSEYMRARRPELFSDSITVEEEPLLGREVFEYHLDTLTSRKQEYEFEHFARRLAERELCPNLIPQTARLMQRHTPWPMPLP